MIVRIATEGQYRIPDEQFEQLDALDDAVVKAVESGNHEDFERRFHELLDRVRAGELLEDAHLASSDLILPPPDLSLDEAAQEFTGDGLIPD
jgi:hypothetical protein